MSAEQDFMNCPKTLYPTVVQTIDSVTPDSHAWPYPKTVVSGQLRMQEVINANRYSQVLGAKLPVTQTNRELEFGCVAISVVGSLS
jgi:hypothetical protein